jgi:hypothetical protein
MELALAAARVALGQATAADLKSAASAAIDAGLVTPDIAALAMLGDHTLSEAEPIFRKALGNLGIEVPGIEEATWILLRAHVQGIAARTTDPDQGLRDMLAVFNAADLPGQSRDYVGDSHDLQALIGLYWEIDEVLARRSEVGFNRQYGASLDRLRQQVVDEATNWISRHAA